MSNVSAGIGRGQMEVLDLHVTLRRKMHDFYVALFKNIDGAKIYECPNLDYFSNYWLSVLLISADATHGITINKVRTALDIANIESRPLWKPMHLQPIFKTYPYYGNKVAESLFENGLCLPSGSNLTDGDRVRIKAVLLDVFK